MQRLFNLLLLTSLTILFAVSCKTAAAPAEAPKEAEKKSEISEEQQAVNEAFEKVYGIYYSDLILDGAETYTVKAGDTLTKIAKAKWVNDSPYYFPVFILASHEYISDPDLIEPGMLLVIPDLTANLNSPKARASIKAFLKDIADVYAGTNKKHREDMQKHLTDLSDSL
jgi:hypothetical protein